MKIIGALILAIVASLAGYFAYPQLNTPHPVVVSVSKWSDCLPDPTKFKEGKKEAERYMRSKERTDCYKKAWPAAEKVAAALLAGKFGDVEKYDEWKKPLKKGYEGWGGIQAKTKNREYAWVYWRNGTIDTRKGVKGFSIGSVHVEQGDREDPYTSALSGEDGEDYYISLVDFGNPDLPHYRIPATIGQLTALDRKVMDRLPVELRRAGLL